MFLTAQISSSNIPVVRELHWEHGKLLWSKNGRRENMLLVNSETDLLVVPHDSKVYHQPTKVPTGIN